jgi:hypothetical protein
MNINRYGVRRCAQILTLALTFVGLAAVAVAQVNTEAYRRSALKDGWNNRIGVNVSYVDGNTEYLELGVSGRSDLLVDDWYTFVVASYDRRLSNDEVIVNKGFAHLRGVFHITPFYGVEAFVQKQFNDFLRLQDRNLAGGGGRFRPLYLAPDSATGRTLVLFVGIGAMYEYERTDGLGGGVSNLVRSTNYLSFHFAFDDRVGSSMTGYYQPAFEQFDDFRILVDASLSFRISDVVSWSTTVEYRYDSQPPPDLRPFDITLENGLSLEF